MRVVSAALAVGMSACSPTVSSQWPEPTAGPAGTGALVAVEEPSLDCLGRVLRVADAVEAGVAPGEIPPLPLLLAGTDGGTVDDAGLDLRPDPSNGCRLDVTLGASAVEQIEGPAHRIESSFESGTCLVDNPAFAEAEQRLRAAGRTIRSRRSGIVRTGDPGVDLIGSTFDALLTTWRDVSTAREETDAAAALETTPRQISEPVFAAYSYDERALTVRKRAPVRLVLTDLVDGRRWTAEASTGAERSFVVVEGMHPKDHAHPNGAGVASAATVAAWSEEPPRPDLPALLKLLRHAVPSV